jgi:HNH endonuclease
VALETLLKEAEMKCKKPSAEQVWKQLEDVLIPRLRLSVIERAVYYHLLRHSRLEGKFRLRISIKSLGHGTRLSDGPVREAVRRLVDQGALRLVRRSKTGHVVEVRVPEEIRGVRFATAKVNGLGSVADMQGRRGGQALLLGAARVEEIDFVQTKALREAIHSREGGRCFYCLRRLAPTVRCLDHVVPRAQLGRNSYRNLVSSCLECNSRKGEKAAEDFLRWLYRERRLTATELTGRLRALKALAGGRLRPAVQVQGIQRARK